MKNKRKRSREKEEVEEVEEEGGLKRRRGSEAKKSPPPLPENEEEEVDDEVILKEPEVRLSPNGYVLPPPLPPGLRIQDTLKRSWRLVSSIGVGGFGEIYSASFENEEKENFVIKVEPHSNGPLFVEINFYSRCASFKGSQKPRHIGVPEFIASGSFLYSKKKYRFLVLPRLGEDIDKMMTRCGGYFDTLTSCNIGIQVINALEYIHSKGFVHKDIKSSNLMLHSKDKNQVFLADFGLASRYIHAGIHKPYVEDCRWANEGTLEYTSRDAHLGCPSRRGDIEVLFYNIIEWLGGRLPWEHPELQKPSFYKREKIIAFENPLRFLESCFGADGYPDFIYQLMLMIKGLNFTDRPNYNDLRALLRQNNHSCYSLPFTKMPPKTLVTFRIPQTASNQENIEPNFNSDGSPNPPKKPLPRLGHFSFGIKEGDHLTRYYAQRERKNQELIKKSWENPTPVMIEVFENIKYRKRTSKLDKRSLFRKISPTSLTPAMQAVLQRKKNAKKGHLYFQSSPSTNSLLQKLEGKPVYSHNRELLGLKNTLKESRVVTRSHSVPNTISITSRSLRKQVRDAFDLGLGNIGHFLKSLYPFKQQ